MSVAKSKRKEGTLIVEEEATDYLNTISCTTRAAIDKMAKRFSELKDGTEGGHENRGDITIGGMCNAIATLQMMMQTMLSAVSLIHMANDVRMTTPEAAKERIQYQKEAIRKLNSMKPYLRFAYENKLFRSVKVKGYTARLLALVDKVSKWTDKDMKKYREMLKGNK